MPGTRSLRLSIYASLFCFISFATAADSQKNTGTSINQPMGEMARSVQRLYPAILENNGPLGDAEFKELKRGIKELQQHLIPLESVFEKRAETRSITLQTILEHLKQAENALNNNRQDYALNLLHSTTTLCMACHTQDKKLRALNTNNIISFKTSFATAEYLYMTRSYLEALKTFKIYIQERGKIDYDKQTIDAMDRILVIYIQVLNKPDEAKRYFSTLLNEGKLAGNIAQDIKLWIKGLDNLPGLIKDQAVDYKGLKMMAEQHIFQHQDQTGPIHISEEKRPFYVWLRGALYNYANLDATAQQMPEILYWLAISDRVLEYRFFYSLADLYLKQCIMGYSDHPVAKQCYKEYENYITFAYSGSGGTHIPDDIYEELKELKMLLPQ